MLVALRLTKHFGSNTAGEVATFTPVTAAHILKSNGGEKLCEYDELTQAFDAATNKAVPLVEKKKS
jgi:hypothetical protein